MESITKTKQPNILKYCKFGHVLRNLVYLLWLHVKRLRMLLIRSWSIVSHHLEMQFVRLKKVNIKLLSLWSRSMDQKWRKYKIKWAKEIIFHTGCWLPRCCCCCRTICICCWRWCCCCCCCCFRWKENDSQNTSSIMIRVNSSGKVSHTAWYLHTNLAAAAAACFAAAAYASAIHEPTSRLAY